MEPTEDKSHLTAISRKSLSSPAKWLLDNNLLVGRLLDYGCGKGTDASILKANTYDPYYFQFNLTGWEFDTIYCIYVLNVLPAVKIPFVLDEIKQRLASNGIAYLVVRRDIKQEGLTSKGTEQWNVVLDLPIVVEKKNKFCIYKLVK